MAAPLAVLSNTHHTSSAVGSPRTVLASVAMAFSSYLDQYVRGDPCSRKYASRGQPAGTIAAGTGGGSAVTRAIRYRSRSEAAGGENHVACLGSHTTGPSYTVRTISRNAVTTGASNDRDGGSCTSTGPRFSGQAVGLDQKRDEWLPRVLQLQFMRNRAGHFDGEPKIRRRAIAPLRVGGRGVRPIERRIDLSATERPRVSFEVRSWPFESECRRPRD